MIGWWGSVGIYAGEECSVEVEGINGELKVMDNCLESSRVVTILMDDQGDFKMYSLINLLPCWTSMSAINSGFRTILSSALLDFVLNNDKSNDTSKESSSSTNQSSMHESTLIKDILLTWLYSFLDFLEIRMGL